MADVSVPEVVVDLSGEIFTLTPGLGAAIGINAKFGGIYVAGQQAQNGDIAAIATIIRYGAGLEKKAEADLVGKVFAAGVMTVSAKALEFIGLLMNGGQQPKGDVESGEA
jgi:hypothetical protein